MNNLHNENTAFQKYKVIGMKFFKFAITSGTSCLIDLGLFQLFAYLLKTSNAKLGIEIWIATVAARILSSLYNYFMNKKIVFSDQQKEKNSLIRYYTLCMIQMCASAFFVWLLCTVVNFPELIVKMIVDVVLFLISFQVQRIWVFK